MLAIRNGVTYAEGMPKKKLPPDIRDYFVRMGRKGGKLGGPARSAAMTKEERTESARKAVEVRWAKIKKTKE
jgi:hypothetical protein